MVQDLLNKYIWLIGIFIKAGRRGLSLREVLDKWEDRWDAPYSRRSFCNHREAVFEVFGIEIECDRSTNRYFIADGESVTDTDSAAAWMINSFTINNLLSLSRERLSGRVSIESIPSGQKWLTRIMGAMESGNELEMSYRKYTASETELLHVRPYGLKEHEKRWYLVAWCLERKAMRVYGLDRIVELVVMESRFQMPKQFDIEELFSGSFGIYLPGDKKTVRVVFKADDKESNYLRDLPIHASQKETSPGLFEIRVVPDDNLLIELCHHGDRIEVLEPQDIRDQVAQAHRRAWEKYETKQ